MKCTTATYSIRYLTGNKNSLCSPPTKLMCTKARWHLMITSFCNNLLVTPTCMHTGNGIWTALNVNRNALFFPFSSDSVQPALEGFIRFWSFLIVHQVTCASSVITGRQTCHHKKGHTFSASNQAPDTYM